MRKLPRPDHPSAFSACSLSRDGLNAALQQASTTVASYLWIAAITGWGRDTLLRIGQGCLAPDWQNFTTDIQVPDRSRISTVNLHWALQPELADGLANVFALLQADAQKLTDAIKRIRRSREFRSAAPGQKINHERVLQLGRHLTPSMMPPYVSACLNLRIPGRLRARMAYLRVPAKELELQLERLLTYRVTHLTSMWTTAEPHRALMTAPTITVHPC